MHTKIQLGYKMICSQMLADEAHSVHSSGKEFTYAKQEHVGRGLLLLRKGKERAHEHDEVLHQVQVWPDLRSIAD